ncbi:MAG: Fic family protein [Candidatus Babeliales bacterium]|jgi:Fic family protein
MPIKFLPRYEITSKIANYLMRIEAVKEKTMNLPITPQVLASLRETARLYTTHYSTMIEGNRLEPLQIQSILQHAGHFPGRERDEREVKGYYTALIQIEKWAARGVPITQTMIKELHALVMADGRKKVQATSYRDGQNVIKDSRTGVIVYMPPEAKDVAELMKAMIDWTAQSSKIPCPIVAGIVHYQFATIHPYYDGNGRTARLLTTLILHARGYDLKGLYSLEEYYARDLNAYYDAISIGESHNYYMGRAQADITKWVEYVVEGMAISFENVLKRMSDAALQGMPDHSQLLRSIDPRQRKALSLLQEFETITSKQVGEIFGFQPRTSAQICKDWVDDGFLEIVDFSNKGRKYKLAERYEALISSVVKK